jgi:hypothetical protein
MRELPNRFPIATAHSMAATWATIMSGMRKWSRQTTHSDMMRQLSWFDLLCMLASTWMHRLSHSDSSTFHPIQLLRSLPIALFTTNQGPQSCGTRTGAALTDWWRCWRCAAAARPRASACCCSGSSSRCSSPARASSRSSSIGTTRCVRSRSTLVASASAQCMWR